jgi:DNA anti-recombination protein RmuC
LEKQTNHLPLSRAVIFGVGLSSVSPGVFHMPSPPHAAHPSQQVEKIREILVGRQMRAVEQRLERLERELQPMPVESAETAWARDLESLRHELAASTQNLRDALDAERLRRQEETERLARRIESIARSRREAADETRRAVGADLRSGFDRWQSQLFEQLQQRENRLLDRLRDELGRMRGWVKEELGSHRETRIHDALEQLASSVREISEKLPPRP